LESLFSSDFLTQLREVVKEQLYSTFASLIGEIPEHAMVLAAKSARFF
jgi:hypothetical protein